MFENINKNPENLEALPSSCWDFFPDKSYFHELMQCVMDPGGRETPKLLIPVLDGSSVLVQYSFDA